MPSNYISQRLDLLVDDVEGLAKLQIKNTSSHSPCPDAPNSSTGPSKPKGIGSGPDPYLGASRVPSGWSHSCANMTKNLLRACDANHAFSEDARFAPASWAFASTSPCQACQSTCPGTDLRYPRVDPKTWSPGTPT